MSEDNKVHIDPVRARLVQLGFKKATEGLTPEEQKELERLRQQDALNRAANGG